MVQDKQFARQMGLRNLTAGQVEQLHQAALEILEQVGVKVCDPEAVSLLKRAGAAINGDLAKIKPPLIEQALATAPSGIAIYNRGGSPAMTLEKDNIYFGPGSDTPYVIDLESGARRFAVKQDTINAAILSDALENMDFVMSLARASDVPAGRIDRHHFEAMILNSTKPIIFDALDRQGLLEIIAMASLAAGGRKALRDRPYVIHYTEPTSPLTHSMNALQKLLTAADEGIPLIYAPAVMCGATGPVTTAGALAMANAECLSGLVIHQLKNEGAPFIYGGGTPPLNMITTVCSYGDPQGNLGAVCLVQLAQYYKLPSFSLAGCSDAQVFDQQAAMEAGFNLLMAALSGANLIHDLGYIGAGLTSSLEFLVLCNEGAGAVRFMLTGIELKEETLALDLIKSIGPGGHFLCEQHTLDHFRGQMHFTKLFNRNNYDNWLAAGSKTCCQYANDMVKEILKWHEVPALDPEVEKAIKAIAAGAGSERELA